MSESTSTDEPASSAGFPSWSDLTDTSRYSIYAILVSLFLIVTLWRGIKICGCLEKRSIVTETKIDEEGKEKQMKYEEIEYTYVHILWPFKVLTVLFHEMSHAMVGMATLGRVAYISVDAQEGGETQFRPPPARQPAYKPTLAAGYLGSCLIGCALLGAGFDALASKYAALALIFYLLVLLFICASIRTKSTLTHNRDRIAYWFNRILGYKSAMETRLKRLKKKEKEVKDNQDKMGSMRDRMEQLLGRMQRGELRSRDKRKDEKELEKLEMEFAEVAEVVYREKMVSLDTICLVAFLILLFILPSWLIADSAGLRFVILFIGLFSAVYAVQDIYDDCIRNRHVHGSDANAYARITLGPLDLGEEEVRTRQGREKLEGYEKDVRRRTKFLAWLSLTLQLFALLVTILLTLYFVRTTTAEQALESRSFLPSPWHLNSADLLEQAQKGKEGLKSGVDWGKGKIGEVWDGDEA